MYKNYEGRLLSLNPIKRLSLCEVFVFGSNLDGHHSGGAARTAMDNFGAAKPDSYVEPERASFPERPSAINAVNDNEHVTKIIRNGQVLIIKGNNIYNVLGNEVK